MTVRTDSLSVLQSRPVQDLAGPYLCRAARPPCGMTVEYERLNATRRTAPGAGQLGRVDLKDG